MADNPEVQSEKLLKYGKKQLSNKGLESQATTIREVLDDISNISAGGASEELDGVVIPETFYNTSTIYSFDMGDEVLLSCDIAGTGLYKYSKIDNSLTQIYESGYKWSNFQMIEDDCFISSVDYTGTSNGLLCYNKTNNTVTIIHDETRGYVFQAIFEDKTCLVSKSEAGVWLFDYPTKTMTLQSINKYADRFCQIEEDCVISSTNVNWGSSGGVYLYENSTKTFTKIYSTGHGWQTFTRINNNCIIGAGTQQNTYSGKGILLYNGTTKQITSLLSTGQLFNRMLVNNNQVIISSGNSSTTGIYVYDDTDISLTKVYSSGYQWDILVKATHNKILISGSQSYATGIVGYDIETKTATLLYSERYNWNKTVDLDNNDCLIANTSTSYNGILYYNDLEFTITQLYTTGGWHNFYKLNDDCVITSAGTSSSNDNGILYYNNTEKTITKYTSIRGSNFISIGSNGLLYHATSMGIYKADYDSKSITQIYKYGYYDKVLDKDNVVTLYKEGTAINSYIFKYDTLNQKIKSVEKIME